jgi:hypothetical protein
LTKTPFAFEDAFELLGPALPGGAIVLVGGQALIYWLTYYRDRVKALRQLSFVTSDDVDVYGTQDDARRMADAIAGSDLRHFGVDSLSAATAIVRFRDQAGEERQIDFLRTIHGLDTGQVRTTAIEVELQDRANNPTGVKLRILHPVLCLVSRFHEARHLSRPTRDRHHEGKCSLAPIPCACSGARGTSTSARRRVTSAELRHSALPSARRSHHYRQPYRLS